MSIMSEEEKEAIDYLKNDVVYWLDKGKDFVVIDIGENEKLHSILNLIDNQKKEIEEKTTIIMAGAEKVKQLEKGNRSLMESRIKWKNRYYKEKAKNKEKKAISQAIIRDTFSADYISKDEVREKIKEFQDVKKTIIKSESKLLRASITYDIVRNDYCEKMLEELLGEIK